MIELDLIGLKCPLPVLRTRKALSGLKCGARLRILASDPLSGIDIPALLTETRDVLIEASQNDGVWRFEIEKR